MSVLTVGSWAPTKVFSYFTPGNNTSWLLLSQANATGGSFTPPQPPALGCYIMLRTVTQTGLADGSPFMVLFDQSATAAPANNVVGFLVSGSGQVLNMPFSQTVYTKLTAASDIIHCLLIY